MPISPKKDDSSVNGEGLVFTADLLPFATRGYLPEISLVAAIFEDAVRCVRRAKGSVTHGDSSAAREWMASERIDWPFAFRNVCDFLGVDANVVRMRLRIAGSRGSNR